MPCVIVLNDIEKKYPKGAFFSHIDENDGRVVTQTIWWALVFSDEKYAIQKALELRATKKYTGEITVYKARVDKQGNAVEALEVVAHQNGI